MNRQLFVYSFVAQGTVVLAEFKELERGTGLSELAVQWLPRLPVSNKIKQWQVHFQPRWPLLQFPHRRWLWLVTALSRLSIVYFLTHSDNDTGNPATSCVYLTGERYSCCLYSPWILNREIFILLAKLRRKNWLCVRNVCSVLRCCKTISEQQTLICIPGAHKGRIRA